MSIFKDERVYYFANVYYFSKPHVKALPSKMKHMIGSQAFAYFVVTVWE